MANIDEIQSLLSPLRISISSESDDRFIFDLSGSSFYILKSEVDNYLEVKDKIVSDPETSIFHTGYYEHLIEYQAPIPAMRRFGRGRDDVFQLQNHDNSLSIEISPASTLFLLNIIQQTDNRTVRRRIFIPPGLRYEKSKTPEHWSVAFRRLITVKVSSLKETSLRMSKAKFFQIAESALFHIAYGSGDGIYLSRSWERTYYRMNQRRDIDVQFPKRTYESELVSYYQLALSSESLMLSYIALYKIVEYFFLSASEKVLHKLIADKIVQPEFSHTKPTQLRQLTALVRKHDQRMDEPKMLTTVIEQFFPPTEGEIETWIKEYESVNGVYYTTSQQIFDETQAVDLTPNKISSSIAKRIYHIRNVLVHNKESDFARFIPFSGQETVLSKEIPLILYLAEQLILKTGKDL